MKNIKHSNSIGKFLFLKTNMCPSRILKTDDNINVFEKLQKAKV